jgi:hypothetical protein
MTRGLDHVVDSSWHWYRERHSSGEPCDVLLEHFVSISAQCDEVVRDLLPYQTPFYSKLTRKRLDLLEGLGESRPLGRKVEAALLKAQIP